MTTAAYTSWKAGRTPPAVTSRAGACGASRALLQPGPPGTRDPPRPGGSTGQARPGRAAHLQELHPHQLQTLPLEPPDDLPDQVPLDPVRFDGHEGALVGPAPGCKERAGT